MAQDHISVMVTLDPQTEENGALQVCPGRWVKGQVELAEGGIIKDPSDMHFHTVLAEPGDIMFFTGYLPHRSFENKTTQQRRAAFLTYNPASQGDWHDAYYAEKQAESHGFNMAEKLSFSGGVFQGRLTA
ncbi:phnY [Symbiodinium natans]|uniref:PhnY protein n=1 Tax=Symbiodinium natans TaxID=878477 RepID=A0A812U1A4_9DINO|nr:phnY [Symbiodinium natans]